MFDLFVKKYLKLDDLKWMWVSDYLMALLAFPLYEVLLGDICIDTVSELQETALPPSKMPKNATRDKYQRYAEWFYHARICQKSQYELKSMYKADRHTIRDGIKRAEDLMASIRSTFRETLFSDNHP
jgi:hypothetical protein